MKNAGCFEVIRSIVFIIIIAFFTQSTCIRTSGEKARFFAKCIPLTTSQHLFDIVAKPIPNNCLWFSHTVFPYLLGFTNEANRFALSA